MAKERIWRGLAASAAGIMAVVLAGNTGAGAADAPKWSPWLEFGGYYGSQNASRGEVAFWAPFMQGGDRLLFLDARGKLFEQSFLEGNFALGYRQMLDHGWNLGAWGGYDVRRSNTGNVFHQISGGLEALGDTFDLRFNGYLPINSSVVLASSSSTVTEARLTNANSNIALVTDSVTNTTSEVALWGVDAEAGVKLPLSQAAPGEAGVELAIYGGGFWFDHADLAGEVAGPKGRAELRFNDFGMAGSRLTLEAEVSHDAVRSTRYEVGARLRIPLGSAPASLGAMTPQERRMAEALERDTDIVSQTVDTSATISTQEAVEDAMTGVDFDRVAFVDGATAGGISLVSTTAGANSLVIAQGGNGNIAGEQVLQGSQTLLGGGTGIDVRGRTSGTVASFTAPGSAPTLAASANLQDMLTFSGSNARLAGLTLYNPGSFSNVQGIGGGSNKANMVIDRVAVSNVASGIIFIVDNSGVTIMDTTVTDTAGPGVFFGSSNTDVLITDSTLTRLAFGSANGAIGLGSNNALTIADTVIDGGLIPASVPGNNTAYALLIDGTGNTLALTDSQITGGFQGDGVRIDAAGNSLSGTGNIATGADFGVAFCNAVAGQTGAFVFDIGPCP